VTAQEIIDYARAHPDHPVSVSPANWAALVELFDSQQTKLDFVSQQLAALEAHHESDHAKHREEIEQLKQESADNYEQGIKKGRLEAEEVK
jgi:flagellar biosynthesis/type III secretory pathway protein FliH